MRYDHCDLQYINSLFVFVFCYSLFAPVYKCSHLPRIPNQRCSQILTWATHTIPGPIVYKTAEAALWTIFAGLPNTPRPITGESLESISTWTDTFDAENVKTVLSAP